MYQSIYHIYGDEGLFNTKFISKGDGRYEAVYNRDGLLLTEKNDPVNMGTYNYCGPSKNPLTHWLLDVSTYNKWGNVKDCAPMEHGRDIADFLNNQEARDAYDEIKNQMKTN